LILAHGLDLLSRYGFCGITLGPLSKQAGISKSGLFSHFKRMSDLQVELLNRTQELWKYHVEIPTMTAPPGLARLRLFFQRWTGWNSEAGLAGGCPLAAALFELDDAPGDVRDHLRRLEANWRLFTIGLVDEAVLNEELEPGLDSKQFAWELWGIYLSYHVSSRFLHDREAKRRANEAFGSLVTRRLPGHL
jgi:AcrR family transcriptional regulator